MIGMNSTMGILGSAMLVTSRPFFSSSFQHLTVIFTAALNQRRQVYSQWPVVTVMASHTWRAIVMTKSSCLLGLDIFLITFPLGAAGNLILHVSEEVSWCHCILRDFQRLGNAKISITVVLFFFPSNKHITCNTMK